MTDGDIWTGFRFGDACALFSKMGMGVTDAQVTDAERALLLDLARRAVGERTEPTSASRVVTRGAAVLLALQLHGGVKALVAFAEKLPASTLRTLARQEALVLVQKAHLMLDLATGNIGCKDLPAALRNVANYLECKATKDSSACDP